MNNKGQSSGQRDLILQAQGSIGRNGWLVGMITGQILGFTVAAIALSLVKVPPAVAVSTLAVAILVCGYFGGKMGGRLRAQPVLEDKPIREHIFQALVHTNKKLAEMIIDEEFNTASSGSGSSDRRAMKAQPQLKVAPPTPPKMGGL